MLTDEELMQSENAILGSGSIISEMIKNCKGLNSKVRIDAIALDDSETTGNSVFSGASIESETIIINLPG